MRKKLKFGYSLSRDYFVFAIIVAISVLFASAFIAYSSYSNVKKEQFLSYRSNGDKIAAIMVSVFDQTDYFSKLVAKRISQHNTNDPYIISDILQSEITDINNYDIFTFEIFDFVDPEGYVTAARIKGVLDNPVHITAEKRRWIKTAKEQPGRLQLDIPDFSVTSGELVLPTGYGVNGNQGDFLGIVSMGISLNKVSQKIFQVIGNENVSFLILDKNYNLILASDNNGYEKKTFQQNLSSILNQHDSGFLDKPISYNNHSYYFYRNLEFYPYLILAGENNNAINRQVYQSIIGNLINTITLGLFFLILLFFFRKRIIKPIVLLSNTAIAYSQGNTSIPVPEMNSYETKNLANALRKVRNLISKEAEEKMILEEKIYERTKQLEEALSVKTDFANNLSHEVRTPVVGIMGQAEILLASWKRINEEEKYNAVELILNSSKRLGSLVNTVLDTAAFERGNIKLKQDDHDLVKLVEGLIEESTHIIAQKDLGIDFIHPPYAWSRFDWVRIEQVARNLLNNAVRYSNHGGKINISIEIANNNVLFQIKDNGIGIPEDELEKVFEPFTQSSRSNTGAGGTGLGLAISKKIIDMHDSHLYVESSQNISGTKFWFSLPASSPKYSKNPKENNSKLFLNKKILVIDDEEICLKVMKMALENIGCEVVTASGGIEGIELLRSEEHFDIVMLDLMMPDLHGLEVLKIIRADNNLHNTNVIIQSGLSSEHDIQNAKNLGCSFYIKKPYDIELVTSTILKNLQLIDSLI